MFQQSDKQQQQQQPDQLDKQSINVVHSNDDYDDGDDDFYYLKRIKNLILSQDKYRNKLLNLSIIKKSIKPEKAFPKHFDNEKFEYVGSGSYARVYRHELSSKHSHLDSLQNIKQNVSSGRTKIIKLIDVFCEDLLKNLLGVSTSSISTYKHVYNEFRIMNTLSYLNQGVQFESCSMCPGPMFKCPLFPEVYECHLINTQDLPGYFENSKLAKPFDYNQLLDSVHRDSEAETNFNSCPKLSDIRMIRPEVGAIKMEDCGPSLYDQIRQYQPLNVLAATKQILLGFVVAECAYQFEHRDLHLGNILVKEISDEELLYVLKDQFLLMPSHHLMVKVIDTTFSRLKIKSRIHYRDLSHLFSEQDFQHKAGSKNLLMHQSETYQAMASETKNNWSGFYPRTNIVWLIYIIRKFARILRNYQPRSSEKRKVLSILRNYVSTLFRLDDLKTFFETTMMDNELNVLIPIKRIMIDS